MHQVVQISYLLHYLKVSVHYQIVVCCEQNTGKDIVKGYY